MNKIRYNLRYTWPLHFLLTLTNWLPDNVIFLRLRGALARPFFGACGRDLRLGRNVTFYDPIKLHFGNSIYVAYGCYFIASEQISIGDQVMFGPYCVIASGNHTRVSGSYRYGEQRLEPISIGKGTWIGAHAVFTAGSSVGSGAVIAAGAVVAGEIQSNVMVGGIPARVIKTIDDQ